MSNLSVYTTSTGQLDTLENIKAPSPKYCPCCGSEQLRLENLVIEGIVSCRLCKLTMVRKHSPYNNQLTYNDDGLKRAIEAWNIRKVEII